MRAVVEKPHDTVVKFDTYRNLQRHRTVLLAIARHLVIVCHTAKTLLVYVTIIASIRLSHLCHTL